ncbi:MAG: carboxypeptidase M32 [Chlamydiae bacterium]|nr:carboxypeptidase M32 [Chlamydiota bacterium]
MHKREIQDLLDLIRPKSLLQSISYILDWDQETYMPKEGISIRAEQQALISELIHNEATSPKLQSILSKYMHLSNGTLKKEFSQEENAILREVYRDYLQESRLPTEFVKHFKKVTTEALHVWKEAKQKRNFSLFAPHLEEIVRLTREKAKFLGYQDHPYDALLDLYEPNITTKILDTLFADLKERLITLVKKRSNDPKVPSDFLSAEISYEGQIAFSHKIMKDMGISPDTCRLDLTEHPFCLAFGPQDVRITTKYHPNSMIDTVSAVIHEAGHALYQLQLPKEEFGNPLGEPASHGIHESQSRLWEVYIGQSAPFWQHYAKELELAFPKVFKKIDWKAFYLAINQVKPSLIRIFADEVTYSLHIILRYELEKGLLEGSIEVKDLPRLWKEKMEDYLGVFPSHDAEGVLQDIHWSMGYFGYFPSYSLGSMYAASLWNRLQECFPDMEKRIACGDFLFIRDWLKDHVHSKGRLYHPLELIEKATGKPFSADDYLCYLETKYPIH